ncbi:MAG: hypothetical protein AAGD25_16570 [Cyanobacteria bacterium P01_F01_bin.150]
MNRVIVICILGVLAVMLAGKVLKGGLGLLRIALITMLIALSLNLITRPSDSPGLLSSLANRMFSENSVPIVAEASGEVLTDNETSPTNIVENSSSFSTQASSTARPVSRSSEAAFSGSTTTASSNELEALNPPSSTVSTQSSPVQSTPLDSLDTTQLDGNPPATASSPVQPSSSIPPIPSSSRSRPINALW